MEPIRRRVPTPAGPAPPGDKTELERLRGQVYELRECLRLFYVAAELAERCDYLASDSLAEVAISLTGKLLCRKES